MLHIQDNGTNSMSSSNPRIPLSTTEVMQNLIPKEKNRVRPGEQIRKSKVTNNLAVKKYVKLNYNATAEYYKIYDT